MTGYSEEMGKYAVPDLKLSVYFSETTTCRIILSKKLRLSPNNIKPIRVVAY